MGPVGEEETASTEIGQRASEMAGQIELTARDLARVGQEATALAGALARKVASAVGSHPEVADGSEISQQANEVAKAIQRTTGDALRIAEKAVEMASEIAKAPSGGSDKPAGKEPQK
jgi:methyl-accepting chemotaxis protein